MSQADIAKVKSADEMDVETFLKHINARHTPIGKMTKFGRSNIPGDENEDLLRTYHRKVHEHGADHPYNREVPVNHTHKESK